MQCHIQIYPGTVIIRHIHAFTNESLREYGPIRMPLWVSGNGKVLDIFLTTISRRVPPKPLIRELSRIKNYHLDPAYYGTRWSYAARSTPHTPFVNKAIDYISIL